MLLHVVMGAALAARLFSAPAPSSIEMALANPAASDLAGLFRLTLDTNTSLSREDELHDHNHAHDHAHNHEEFHLLPVALGANIFEGWLDPWQHSDYSRRGTPFVHLFLSEPAYLDRDLFLDFAYTTGDEGDEFEAEIEIEYALTRRIGVVFEAPLIYLNPEEGETEFGLGDIAVAPRFLLLDHDRVLLAANLEFAFPTGDDSRGLGAGETVIGPSLSAWLDLGCDFTLQGNIGVEHGLSSNMDVLAWGGAIAHSLYLGGKPTIIQDDGAVRGHFPVGMLSLIAEIRGEHPLDGDEEGNGTATCVFGASYTFAPALEVRAGFMFAPWKPREFDHGVIAGLIWHF